MFKKFCQSLWNILKCSSDGRPQERNKVIFVSRNSSQKLSTKIEIHYNQPTKTDDLVPDLELNKKCLATIPEQVTDELLISSRSFKRFYDLHRLNHSNTAQCGTSHKLQRSVKY